MKTKLIVALVVISLAAAVIVTAVGAQRGVGPGKQAGPGPGARAPGWECPMWGLGPRLTQQLNLTQDQVNQLRQLRQDFWNATQTTREQLQAKCKEMIGLWTAAQPDASRIKALAADIDALRAEIRDTGIDYMIRALNVLTPAQREKLRSMVKDMGERCLKMSGGCCFGPGIGCGLGLGLGPGAGMGPRNATGPRAQMGTCPKLKK